MLAQRTCLGCGMRDHQQVLLRLRIGAQGRLEIKRRGTGRSGYLHRRESCWRAFLGRRSSYRAFRTAIDKSAKEQLVRALIERNQE